MTQIVEHKFYYFHYIETEDSGNLLLEKCFKVKVRKAKGKTGTMFFQIAINLICTFSYTSLTFVFIMKL